MTCDLIFVVIMDPRFGAGGLCSEQSQSSYNSEGAVGVGHQQTQSIMMPRLVGGLKCSDMRREMEDQLVILTGGRDRRGAPVLSFLQNPRREKAKSEDYKKLLDYLIGVPW